ncbi:hypothetical protein ACJJTC_002864 [Scirpophaga incertulas]
MMSDLKSQLSQRLPSIGHAAETGVLVAGDVVSQRTAHPSRLCPRRYFTRFQRLELVKHAPTRDQNVYSEKNKVPAIDQIINPNNRYQEFHEEHLDSSSVANEEADVTIEEEKHGPVNSNNFESSQNHSVENMLKFLKVISQTIKRNTHGSVTSKTKYLQNLKDSILANIEERIESLWPERRSRRRRAARGHLEIPSSESALMSISFLTFAVFLIKLVLQLIQTYKNKTMMVAPTVVAAVGRAAAAASSSPKP